MSTRYYTVVASPIGDLMLVSDGDALCRLSMLPHPDPEHEGWVADASKLAEAARQLTEYFAGQRREFELPLAPEGTDFQRKVWRALREIPFGQTESYGKLAERIGQPAASRAVGAANGRNPIAVIVPCHRVIGSKGTLTGFGGGLDRKSWLLAHEGAAFKPNPVRRERSVPPVLTESAGDAEPGGGLATEFEAAGREGALTPISESSPELVSVD